MKTSFSIIITLAFHKKIVSVEMLEKEKYRLNLAQLIIKA